MKKTALLLGLVSMFALASCGGNKGTETTKEEFVKKGKEIETKQAKGVTIEYTFKSHSETPNLFPKGEDDKVTIKDANESAKIEFTFGDGGWETKDTTHKYYQSLLEGLRENLKDMVSSADFNVDEAQYGVKATTKYYVNPFGMEVTAKGEGSDSEYGSVNLDMSAYTAFDNYGAVTKFETKTNLSMSAKIGDVSFDLKNSTEVSATYTYSY